ncbi:dihydroneopterin aldolase [Candidatus Kaiserbacteria bacterium]|nr:dihydroneopterin aldolase [Candidatus Kaiserbacteria bacterium]
MDTIFIQDLVIRGKHGVSEEERAHEQEFILDISIDFDTQKAAESCELQDTIDYNFFRSTAHSVVRDSSFLLIETLADTVARKILENTRINYVSVTVKKTEMFDDCIPGVTVVRKKS